MKVKLVISDVDGTLVQSDKTVADDTVAAVAKLKAAGGRMSLISARPPSGLRKIIELLDLDGPFGAFNGGTLFKRDGSFLSQTFVEPQAAEACIELLNRAGVTIWVFSAGSWYVSDESNPHIPREIRSADIQPLLTSNFSDHLGRIDKIVGVSDDRALMERLEADARQLFGTLATVARSQPYYLDVTATVANKGDGVRALARAYEVDLSELAVFGDQANDLPMFALAGLSVAMGQGPAHVRAAATQVSASNDEGGVAKAIESVILPRLRD